MTEPTTRCVICTGDRTAHRGLLCDGHFNRMAQMLRDVEDQAIMLDARPSMAIQVGSGKGSLASERAPARLDVLALNDRRSRPAGNRPPGPACVECWHGSCTDIRGWLDAFDSGALHTISILDVLGSWARIVREERDLTIDGAATITGERDLLTRHLEWIAGQDWVDEAYQDLGTLVSQLRSINDTGPDKPYCRCPVVLDGMYCRGNVWLHDELQPVWRRYLDRCSRTWEQVPGAAVCDTCGSAWATDADKARLKRMIADAAAEAARPRTDDGREMFTAEELVTQGLVSTISNVRVKAHRLGIVSVDGHYDPAAFQERMSA